MKKYDVFLFDLDGTLTDPKEGIVGGFKYALAKFMIEENDEERLKSFIGPPLKEGFGTYNLSEEKIKEAIEHYREYYINMGGKFENRPYIGIIKVLEFLRRSNKKVIIATSKLRETAEEIADYFELSKYVDITAGSTIDGKIETKGEVIKNVLEERCVECGIMREKVIMIGDRKYDIVGAKENGIDSIGVCYGYGSREELETAGADYIVGNIEELMNLLKEIV